MNDVRVSVVIPIYKPDKEMLKTQISMLMSQTIKPVEIIIVHTAPSEDMADIKQISTVKYYAISKKEFDHALTRDKALRRSTGDLVMFLTQDAVIRNEHLIEELVKPFENKMVAITYARQLPREKADYIEKYTRLFNYPPHDIVKSKQSIKTLGIKAYFCSDVCSCYKKGVYLTLGGFASPAIFNEDMVMAYEAITNDYLVYYASHAQVVHSHSYTFKEEFKRSFDMGVSQKDFEYVFESVSSEKEGVGYVKTLTLKLLRSARFNLIFKLFVSCVSRYLGYLSGRNYKKLPMRLVRKLSNDPGFFDR